MEALHHAVEGTPDHEDLVQLRAANDHMQAEMRLVGKWLVR